MTPTIEELARGLTEAQKRAVLWLPADGSWRERSRGTISQVPLYALRNKVIGNPRRVVCICAHITESRESEGRDKGAFWNNDEWRLTPLGLTLRA